MSVDYVDQSNGGWMTRDYTMDQSDLARMNVTGQTRTGTPVVNGDDAWTNQYLPNQSTAAGTRTLLNGGYDNYAANGWGRDPQTGAAVPPANFAGSTVPGVVGNAAGRNVTSQPAAVPTTTMTPAGPVGMSPATTLAEGSMQRDQAFQLAQTPLDYSSPQALANSRRDRASFVPGGGALYDKLVASGALSPTTTTPTSLLSGLTDPEGKALPGNGINARIASSPAFKQIESQDQLNGTNYAAQFYQNVTGQNLQADRASNSALLALQSKNKLEAANKLADQATFAPADINDLGIKKGDIVKQVPVTPMLPGQAAVGYVPLTNEDRQLLNIMPDKNPDGTQIMDSNGRPSYSARGNSYVHQATGLPSVADVQWGETTRARLAKEQANAPTTYAEGDAWTPTGGKAVPLAQQQTADQQSNSILGDAFSGMTKALTTPLNNLRFIGTNVLRQQNLNQYNARKAVSGGADVGPAPASPLTKAQWDALQAAQ